MKNHDGLKIISNNSEGKTQTLVFALSEKEKNSAIETLVKCIDAGNTITLLDNRDKREGSISLKKENGNYLKSGGGHGFSEEWNIINIKDIKWLIKVTAPFNYGDNEGNYGTIKKNS